MVGNRAENSRVKSGMIFIMNRHILLLSSLFFGAVSWAHPLQEAIDQVPAGAVIRLSAGTLRGNLRIDKPLTLIGESNATHIEGDGNGTVITITSPYVTLKNLTIAHSGQQTITLDAAIRMRRVHHCVVTHCRLEDVLYGIDLDQVRDTKITNNIISSNDRTIPYRGDALKVWYGKNVRITGNTIARTRDVKITFSEDTLFADNIVRQSRYGVLIEHSRRTHIENNTLIRNASGVMTMGSPETLIERNHILGSRPPAGIAILIAGEGHTLVRDNDLRFNAKAFYIDSNAKSTDIHREILRNTIRYNTEALHFHLTIRNNRIEDNIIDDNLDDVVKDIRGYPTRDNSIAHNYWSRYEGFDRDKNGIGDTPHVIHAYADQLWHHDHHLKFFYGTPFMSLLDLLARVAPFTEPEYLLRDVQPVMKREGLGK